MANNKHFLVEFEELAPNERITPSCFQSINGGETIFPIVFTATLDGRPMDYEGKSKKYKRTFFKPVKYTPIDLQGDDYASMSDK